MLSSASPFGYISDLNSLIKWCAIIPVPPEIGDHKYKDKMIITAGSNTSIDLPFTGCPKPEITWTYKGGRLPDTRR